MIFRLILQALPESIANQSQSSECRTPAANPKPNLPDLYSDILVSGSDMEAESKDRSGNQSSPDGGAATHKPTEVPFSEEPEPLIDQRNVPALRRSKAALQVKHKKNDLDRYVRAQDVVDLMATPDMKSYLGIKTGITVRTAQRWLNAMKWRYGKPSKGVYLDGHERPDVDVVEYRKGFLKRMAEYSKRMTAYDKDGNILSEPTGIDFSAGIFPLDKVTQDESTFTMYDRRPR